MPEPDLRDQIKEMLIQYLMIRIPKDEIQNDTPLFGPDGLGLDSIDALELAMALEKTFHVKVPDSTVAGRAFLHVNSLHDFILEEQAKG